MSEGIPEGWSEQRFSQLCSVVNGQVDPKEFPYRKMKHIGPANIEKFTGRIVDVRTAAEDGQTSGKYLFDETNVLYGKINPHLAKVGFPRYKGICSADMYPISCRERKIISGFLFHALLDERFIRYATSVSGRTGMPKINRDDLDLAKLLVPPLSEQQKIASILTSVDDVIEKTEAQISKLQDLKTGMMQELLTKGIGHTEFKDSPVGRIPKEWDLAALPDLEFAGEPVLRTGPFGSSLKSKDFTSSGIPVINIQNLGVGELARDNLFFVSEGKARELSGYTVKAGDLVFSRVADVGRCVVIPEAAAGWLMSSNLMRISVDRNKCVPQYLMYQLVHGPYVKRQLAQVISDAGRQIVTGPIVKQIQFPVATLEEQEEVVSALDAVSESIKQKQTTITCTQNLKAALMQDLLAGKVRVKVN